MIGVVILAIIVLLGGWYTLARRGPKPPGEPRDYEKEWRL